MKRFWSKVDKLDETDVCWLWTGSRNQEGYGLFRLNGLRRAPRVAWELTNGPIPKEMEICHRCNNSSCVNPNHLYLATHKQNCQDAARDGLLLHSKLIAEQVWEVITFQRAGWKQHEIADHFQISQQTVSDILRGKSWKHLTGIKS